MCVASLWWALAVDVKGCALAVEVEGRAPVPGSGRHFPSRLSNASGLSTPIADVVARSPVREGRLNSSDKIDRQII